MTEFVMSDDAMPDVLAGLDPFDLLDVESARIDRLYSDLALEDWSAPTRCTDWNRKELLAHLASVEDSTRAGLADSVDALRGAADGESQDEYNAWGVALRVGLTAPGLLAEWRALSTE